MFAHRCVVVGIMLTTLGGCVALEVGPDRIFTVDDQTTSVRSVDATWPQNLASWNQATRNNFVTERMYAMDLEYNQYFSRLSNQLALGNSTLDIASIALGAAGTAFASSVTKTALSATNTIVAGARTTVDKDVLLSNTIQLLQLTMEGSRYRIRARILQNLQVCSMTQYTIWQALTDLEDYYRAGTLPGGLEALTAQAGNSSQTAKDKTNNTTQINSPPPAAPGTDTSKCLAAQPPTTVAAAAAAAAAVRKPR